MVEGGNPFIEQAFIDGKLLYEKSPGKGPWKEILLSGRLSGTERLVLKKPLETARRWLAQAEHNLNVARLLVDNGVWGGACFQAEQTAQLALKAFLFGKGRRSVTIHSIRELALACAQEDDSFSPFEDYGLFLDHYYLSTRYPDALPAPAVPFESFNRQEAEQALGFADEIVGLARAKIPVGPPESAQ